MFAYEQCLLCLGHHPDIWYEAAAYLEQSSKLLTEKGDQKSGNIFADEAAAIYERATTSLMKSTVLLYFAYADFEEVCHIVSFIISVSLWPIFTKERPVKSTILLNIAYADLEEVCHVVSFIISVSLWLILTNKI